MSRFPIWVIGWLCHVLGGVRPLSVSPGIECPRTLNGRGERRDDNDPNDDEGYLLPLVYLDTPNKDSCRPLNKLGF
jgi:hypothetical protein